tara:strand:- start:782 stop:925 length:144 start_codon:yes stop_codon:yes gene_type:complete
MQAKINSPHVVHLPISPGIKKAKTKIGIIIILKKVKDRGIFETILNT